MKSLFICQILDLEVLVILRDRLIFKNVYTGRVEKLAVPNQIHSLVFVRS
jgi:hypothetical protein